MPVSVWVRHILLSLFYIGKMALLTQIYENYLTVRRIFKIICKKNIQWYCWPTQGLSCIYEPQVGYPILLLNIALSDLTWQTQKLILPKGIINGLPRLTAPSFLVSLWTTIPFTWAAFYPNPLFLSHSAHLIFQHSSDCILSLASDFSLFLVHRRELAHCMLTS